MNQTKIKNIIIEEICNYYGFTIEELKTRSRKKERVECRMFNYYFLCNFTAISLSKIGAEFHRDHSTVLHGMKKLHDLMKVEKQLISTMKELAEVIHNRISEKDKISLNENI